MAYTVNSTLSEVLQGKPGNKAIVDKHVGRPVSQSEMDMALGMSLQTIGGYVGWTPEKLNALLKELNA